MNKAVMKKWLMPAALVLLLAMDAAQAAVAFRAVASAKSERIDGGGTMAVNKPAGTLSGDLMLAAIATAYHDSETVTAPGWTLVRSSAQNSGDPTRLYTFYKVAGGSEPASYSWSFSGRNDGVVAAIASFTGVDTAAPIDVSAAQTTASSVNHATLSVTTTVAGDMLVTAHEYGSSRNWTKPTGMTEAADLYSEGSGDDKPVSMELNYESRPTAGATGTRTATAASDSDNGATHAIALKAAAVSAFDHLRVKHDGEGSNCAAESITVEACADATCTSLVTTGGISASLQPFGTAISIGTSGTVTLSLTPSPTGANTLNATSIAPTPANASPVSCLNTVASTASCSLPVSACPGGANFNCLETSITPYSSGTAKLYTKLAETAFSVDVVALNSSGAVETNYVASGATAKNVTVALFDDSASPQPACSAYVSPVASQTLSLGSANSGRKTTASFTVPNAYTKLRCRVTDANVAPTVYGCSTDDFSLRPAAFLVAQNTPTLNAGSTFTLQATAVKSDLTTVTTNYTAAPTLNPGQMTGTPGFTSAALVPSALPAATAGVSNATFTYDDVGSFTLPATSPGTYGISDSTFTSIDGSSDCVAGSASNTPDINGKIGCLIGQSAALTVGRFYPDHFEITPSYAAGCTSGGFTYMDQPFTLGYTVTAKSLSRVTPNPPGNVALKLYSGGKLNLAAINGSTDWVARLSPAVTNPLSPTWTNGSHTPISTSYTFTRPSASTQDGTWGAFDTLNIGVAVDDADGIGYTAVTSTFTGTTPASCTNSGATECRKYASLTGGATAKMRYGRMALSNAHGSERLALPIPVKLQYYLAGSGWVTNPDDSCTQHTLPASIGITYAALTAKNSLSAAGSSVTAYLRNAAGTYISSGAVTGNRLSLASPTDSAVGPGIGYVDAYFDLASMPWLNFNWKGKLTPTAAELNPTARATFGVYKNANEFIYTREMY